MQQLQQVALDLFEALDTPVSLGTAILLRHGEFDQLALRATDPRHYLDPMTYFKDAQATAFLRKVEDLPTSIDRRRAAVETWLESEQQCYRTNRLVVDALSSPEDTPLTELLGRMRIKMHQLIGRRAPDHLDCKWGNGATYEMSGVLKLLPNKLTPSPTMTENAWPFARDYSSLAHCRPLGFGERDWVGHKLGFGTHHAPSLFCPVIVEGNRFWLVPKNGKTDRAIAIEPTLNVFYQLGLGRGLRTRLRQRGLLHKDSQEVHRTLAASASRGAGLATLDLSSASDTVAYQLVKAITPYKWFQELDAARSPKTNIGSRKAPRWVRLEKFSSMGNGSTFELETAIFTCVCKVAADDHGVTLVARHNFSVYGDDIIIPIEIADTVSKYLTLLGFKLNCEKSFTNGLFYESCGGDYFGGVDVRPVFQDIIPKNPYDWFSLHNRLALAADRGLDVGRSMMRVRSFLPTRLRRLGGPSAYGDSVLHGQEPSLRVRGCITLMRALAPPRHKIPLKRWDDNCAVATLLYAQYRGRPLSDESIGARPDVDWPFGLVCSSGPDVEVEQQWVLFR